MITVPPLWTWMTQHWCPLPASLSWTLWRALSQAQWSTAAQWRAAFLAFERPNRVLSSDLIEAFLAEIASPQQLMDVLEALIHERTLLQRDGRQIEQIVLQAVDRAGQWKHQQGRRQTA